jgi:large subunit ribosomal protein L24
MKKDFSTKWKASKQPRKQRKYVAKAPLHLRKKFLSVNLSKDLRKKHNKRNIVLRKGDAVKVMRGKFKGKKGKVNEIHLKTLSVIVEGVSIKKKDGSSVNVKLKPSNLQITELNLEDKKRAGKLGAEVKKQEKPEPSKSKQPLAKESKK